MYNNHLVHGPMHVNVDAINIQIYFSHQKNGQAILYYLIYEYQYNF